MDIMDIWKHFSKQMWNFLKGVNIPQNIYGGQDCIWYADTLLTVPR